MDKAAKFDPRNPVSIFEGDNLLQFMQGLHNAQRLRLGIDGGDLSRDDVGVCMKALSDAEETLKGGR